MIIGLVKKRNVESPSSRNVYWNRKQDVKIKTEFSLLVFSLLILFTYHSIKMV